jgi:predicted nucleic acid-binding protein
VIFIDTSYWVALLLHKDSHHEEAVALWSSERRALLCTNHVIGETWTYLRRKAGHKAAVSFLDAVGDSERVSVVHVDEFAESEALEWLRRHDEREFSFVDSTSFATMRRSRITEAFAFDGDFAAAGFIELRPHS